MGTSPLFVEARFGVTTSPRVINLLAIRDAHSTVFRHPATNWPHDLSLAPERAGLVREGWRVHAVTEEEPAPEEGTAEDALPILTDPTAQRLMETLRRHEDAKVEKIAQRMTDEITEQLRTGQ